MQQPVNCLLCLVHLSPADPHPDDPVLCLEGLHPPVALTAQQQQLGGLVKLLQHSIRALQVPDQLSKLIQGLSGVLIMSKPKGGGSWHRSSCC